MNKLIASIRGLFAPPETLSPGIYQYQTPPAEDRQYRLHLRVEEEGRGLLILNAETVLHLNQTAAEYAYHRIKGTPEDEVVRNISNRYQITAGQVREDYRAFNSKIESMIEAPDLDPELYLGMEREMPYSGSMSAPYRADVALTYRLPEGSNPDLAPTRRVDRELTTAEWKTILDKLWEAGVPHVTFTGGEPTMRDDLLQLIAYAERKGQVTGLLSDGFRLGDQGYFQDLLLTGLDHLMYVLTPSENQSWTVLEDVLHSDLYTTVHLTIHRQLMDQTEPFLNKLAEMGANAISLSLSAPGDPELKMTLSQARTRAAELKLPLKWDIPVPYSRHNPVALETEEGEPPSGTGQAWMYVEPDGDVLPAQGEDDILGNLLHDPWDKVWSNRS